MVPQGLMMGYKKLLVVPTFSTKPKKVLYFRLWEFCILQIVSSSLYFLMCCGTSVGNELSFLSLNNQSEWYIELMDLVPSCGVRFLKHCRDIWIRTNNQQHQSRTSLTFSQGISKIKSHKISCENYDLNLNWYIAMVTNSIGVFFCSQFIFQLYFGHKWWCLPTTNYTNVLVAGWTTTIKNQFYFCTPKCQNFAPSFPLYQEPFILHAS